MARFRPAAWLCCFAPAVPPALLWLLLRRRLRRAHLDRMWKSRQISATSRVVCSWRRGLSNVLYNDEVWPPRAKRIEVVGAHSCHAESGGIQCRPSLLRTPLLVITSSASAPTASCLSRCAHSLSDRPSVAHWQLRQRELLQSRGGFTSCVCRRHGDRRSRRLELKMYRMGWRHHGAAQTA